ncbi:MAG: maleate cis-trans isomerase, partial [Thermoprotei archaeon]
MFGWRGRIGLVVPSSNTTMESEFWSYVPRGVSIHSARVPLREVTPEALRAMVRSAVEAARLLATADIDILVFG